MPSAFLSSSSLIDSMRPLSVIDGRGKKLSNQPKTLELLGTSARTLAPLQGPAFSYILFSAKEHFTTMSTTRIDILAEKGTEEVLTEEFYVLCRHTWIEDEQDRVVIKCYPLHTGALLDYLSASRLPIHCVTIVEEQERDYADLVRKHFTPVKVGPVTVLPPWRKATGKPYAIVIEPGMAFGTGRHESTKLMLKMMGAIDMKGKKVLDIGCGSGILAIYASMLGASRVVAIDNDPLAVQAAQKSCRLNRREGILLACSHLEATRTGFDVVLANLDFKTFSAWASRVADRVKPGGSLIISGIEAQYADHVPRLFKRFTLVKKHRMKEWHGFVFSKLTGKDETSTMAKIQRRTRKK